MENVIETLEQYLEEAEHKFKLRRQLRDLNIQDNIIYPDESTLEYLDSSIKKNATFVKKLKTFNELQRPSILEELDRLNLTKFTSEAAKSIIEAKLKLSDIPSVIEVCTKLNRTYRDFHKHLLNQYTKYLPTIKKRINDPIISSSVLQLPGSPSHSAQGTASLFFKASSQRSVNQLGETVWRNTARLKVDLRLFSELLIVGILPLRDAFQLLVNFLYYLMVFDKNLIQNASAILTFCKGCGDELLGLVPIHLERLASKLDREIPTSDYITVKRQNFLRNYMLEYFQTLCKNLVELHNELNDLSVKNQKLSRSRGEVNKELRESLELKSVMFQKLQNIILQFSEILNEDAPILCRSVDIDLDGVDSTECQINSVKLQSDDEVNSLRGIAIWDDAGTRSFYEDLIDLKQIFPNLRCKVNSKRMASEESLNRPLDTSDNVSPASVPEASSDISVLEETAQGAESSSSSSLEETVVSLRTSKQYQSANSLSIVDRAQPEHYFNKLLNCVNRDMIDNAAIDFIKFFNTKFGRKKLVKTIFSVKRTRLDLLPFFARLTATLYPYVPSIGSELASQLKSEFKYLFNKKDQINIESKVKNVRYIGEFVKFNLISRQEAIDCMKLLLTDFTHHHIEMTCNLLETSGRLLYRTPDTHHQMKLILEQVMRKKMLLSIDSKYVTMIENAYYFTNPPEVVRQINEEPPVHSYVRYLLYERLNRSTIDEVLQKLKLLDWNNRIVAKFVINRMIEAYNVKFLNIRYFAALLAALNRDCPWISIAVVDGVIEDILLMLEINEIQFNQRRIPMIRYFGELYNYRLTDPSLVFKILYSLITYGVVYPNPNNDDHSNQIALSSLSDPPDNLFRIKLICDLLDTSGPHLNGSQEKKKLDCYLLFFQRYYWCKKHIFMSYSYCLVKNSNRFPASTEFLYNDTIFNLRPNFQMANSYSEAVDSLQGFLQSLQGR